MLKLLRRIPEGSLSTAGQVGADALGRVLARMMIRAPELTSQTEICEGSMLMHPKPMALATVARSVRALTAAGLVSSVARSEVPKEERRGGPVVPLRLGSAAWMLAGVHLEYRAGDVTEITIALTGLDGMPLIEEVSRAVEPPSGLHEVVPEVVARIHEAVAQLRNERHATDPKLLGVGVELGAQVRSDEYVAETSAHPTALGRQISAALGGLPVVVENDVNALALRQAYRPEYPDFALVCVQDGGIGGALVAGGRLRRGAHGVAGEIGHVTVEYRTRPDAEPCSCGGDSGHLDAIATPVRMAKALHVDHARQAAGAPMTVGEEDRMRLSPQALVFHGGGTALGRALASVIAFNDPGRVILLLPRWLARAKPGSAASMFLDAVGHQAHQAFFGVPSDVDAWDPRERPHACDPNLAYGPPRV